MRILLVDDHTLVRSAFRIMLESHDGFMIVGEAGTGAEAIQLASHLRPDLILLDVIMPDSHGLEVASSLLQINARTKLILLTMQYTQDLITEALRVGVHGYVAKFASEQELIHAIQQVATGHIYLSDSLTKKSQPPTLSTESPTDLLNQLTPRQITVLTLIGKGYSTKAIARELGISTRTVDVHRSQLVRRLNIRDIAGLIRYAILTGLVKV